MHAARKHLRRAVALLALAGIAATGWWGRHALELELRPVARQGVTLMRSALAAGVFDPLREEGGGGQARPQVRPAVAQRELHELLASLPWPFWTTGTVKTPPAAHGTTYYVSPHGSNDNDGLSPAKAFATPQAAADVARAGDTVLIAAGLYRGTLIAHHSGTPGHPITFGSDGSGPVIIDGSPALGPWSRESGSVWSTPIRYRPIAVVVDGQALRPSLTGVRGVTSGSGLWAVSSDRPSAGGDSLVVDFGTGPAASDPDRADIVAPGSDGAQTVVYFYDQHDLVFNGLTVRGSGASGIWGYGSDITVSHCTLEFNGKAGINFMPMQGNANSGNRALYNRVYMNVLLNWPRGNNGFAASGGGWSGGLVFSGSLDGVARGNLVYDNGGEGIISFGSQRGRRTGSTLFEHNVAFDNWSVNMYFDNQPGDTARANILFDHPVDTGLWLKPPSAGYPWNQLYKFSVCLMLADEAYSSDGPANLAHTTVTDNLIAGCRIGIRDYAEGHLTTPHGLKHTLIANNTIILPRDPLPFGGSSYTAGMQLLANGHADVDSRVANNVFVGYSDDTPLVWLMRVPDPDAVRLEHDFYADTATRRGLWLGVAPRRLDLGAWQQALRNDAASGYADASPLRGHIAESLRRGGFFRLDDARPRAKSGLVGAGANLSARFGSALDDSAWGKHWAIGALP